MVNHPESTSSQSSSKTRSKNDEKSVFPYIERFSKETEGRSNEIQLQKAIELALEKNTVQLTEVKLNRENWNNFFPNGTVETPIGTVKLGENQFDKLQKEDRNNLLAAMYETLSNPSIVLEKETLDKNSGNFKPVNVYGKSFVREDSNHKRIVESVVIFKDGDEISIGTHNKGIGRFTRQIKTADQIIFADSEISRVASLILENGESHVQLKGINTQALNPHYNKNNLVSINNLNLSNEDIIAENKTPKTRSEYLQGKIETLEHIEDATDSKSDSNYIHSEEFISKFGDWEKAKRLEKLIKSESVQITGTEITSSDNIKEYKKNAIQYGKNLRGEYENLDSGKHIILTSGKKNGGIYEILEHDYKDKDHLQSIAAIPQIIEKSIYISSQENEDTKKHPNIEKYEYYLCGLKIENKDYTVKAVIAKTLDGKRYYDHKLTDIEKGQLIESLKKYSVQKSSVSITTQTPDNERFQLKDKRLYQICQYPQSIYLNEKLEPSQEAVQAVKTGKLYLEKDENGIEIIHDETEYHLKEIRSFASERPLVVRGGTQSIPSSTAVTIKGKNNSVNDVFNSLLIRGEISMLRKHTEIKDSEIRYQNALNLLEAKNKEINDRILQSSNNKFIQKEKELSPKTRSEYLHGKTELSDVDIINILDLPVEKRSINNEIYTDKSYKELKNNPEELSSLTENLKTKPEYLKYHSSYIAKSKLLYQESDVLCNEIPCLMVLNQLKKTAYLLPYEYAANKYGAAITSADALKSNTFTDFKRVFNHNLHHAIEKGAEQGKDIFFLINSEKLNYEETKKQLIKFTNNRTSKNKEGTYLFFSEKDFVCYSFESDKDGFVRELSKYDLKEIRAAISSKPLTPSRESEKKSDSLASNLNITQENSDVNKLFSSLLLRGEIALLEKKKDIENRQQRYFTAVKTLEKLNASIHSEIIKKSNSKFIEKEYNSRFFKSFANTQRIVSESQKLDNTFVKKSGLTPLGKPSFAETIPNKINIPSTDKTIKPDSNSVNKLYKKNKALIAEQAENKTTLQEKPMENQNIEPSKTEFSNLKREERLQKMTGTLTPEEQKRYFTFNETDTAKFKSQVDEWKKSKDENSRFNPGKLIEVGEIPPLFNALGIADNPIEVQYSTLSKLIRPLPEGYPNEAQGHALSVDDIYSIPKQLADPVMVFKSRTRDDSYVFFTERKDSQNRSILIPMAVNKRKGRIVINEITSMYGRNNEIDFVKTNIDEGNLIYADKKRSLEWERECKVQFLTQGLPSQDSIGNILTKENIVKFISTDVETRNLQEKNPSIKKSQGDSMNKNKKNTFNDTPVFKNANLFLEENKKGELPFFAGKEKLKDGKEVIEIRPHPVVDAITGRLVLGTNQILAQDVFLKTGEYPANINVITWAEAKANGIQLKKGTPGYTISTKGKDNSYNIYKLFSENAVTENSIGNLNRAKYSAAVKLKIAVLNRQLEQEENEQNKSIILSNLAYAHLDNIQGNILRPKEIQLGLEKFRQGNELEARTKEVADYIENLPKDVKEVFKERIMTSSGKFDNTTPEGLVKNYNPLQFEKHASERLEKAAEIQKNRPEQIIDARNCTSSTAFIAKYAAATSLAKANQNVKFITDKSTNEKIQKDLNATLEKSFSEYNHSKVFSIGEEANEQCRAELKNFRTQQQTMKSQENEIEKKKDLDQAIDISLS